jgi:hypothetical protein
MAARAHDHERDDKAGQAHGRGRTRGPVGEQVVESMAGSGRMPDGVRLGGQFDPEETSANEVAARVVQQRPAGDDSSIIAAARRAGARVPNGVRIHQGGRANAAAASMQASAFTVGHDVYLTDDAVRTPEQRLRVLAHELTHTGQDRGHGRAAPGNQPVVQRLWNPFKKKGPSAPHVGVNRAEEERELRKETKGEDRRGALAESPVSATDLSGQLAGGGHDSTTVDIGSEKAEKGQEERGSDGWEHNDKAKHLEGWADDHQSDANNMSYAAQLNALGAGDIGGSLMGFMDAKNKKGVDGTLAKGKAGLLAGKGATDLTGLALTGVKNYGHSSALSNHDLGTGAQVMEHGGGWLGSMTSGVGAVQDLKSWGSDTADWFKGKRNMEKATNKAGEVKQVGLSMGRGMAKLGSAGSKVTQGVSKTANLVGQAAHSAGNASLSTSASSVGSVAGHALAPLQMALGGVDVLKGGYNLARKAKHRMRLTEMKEKIGKDTLNLDGGKQIKALDHLTEVAKKKQIRQGINMATGAAGVLGGALTVSGFGAIPGAAIGAGVGAFKLGQFGARKAKQAGRNWAEKYNAKGEDDKSWLGKKAAGIFDTSKSSKNKQKRYEETADTLLDMDAADLKKAVKTLGIHDLDTVPEAERKALIVEKLKKRT